jgi:hypothetical protein
VWSDDEVPRVLKAMSPRASPILALIVRTTLTNVRTFQPGIKCVQEQMKCVSLSFARDQRFPNVERAGPPFTAFCGPHGFPSKSSFARSLEARVFVDCMRKGSDHTKQQPTDDAHRLSSFPP